MRAAPAQVHVVHYHSDLPSERLAPIVAAATAAGVAVQAVGEERLATLAGHGRHLGVVATVPPFPYAELGTVLRATPRLLLVADRIQDPHNLGALIRTAETVGAGAVIIPKDGSVPITPAVEVAAAGATALVPVCRVVNVARTLRTVKEHGYWTLGLVPQGGGDLYGLEPPERAVVVVGGEEGMRVLVREQCDLLISIPMMGKIGSLNASVAAAVAVYELVRRWRALDRRVSVL